MHKALPVHSPHAITESMSIVYAPSNMLSALPYPYINFFPAAEDECNPTVCIHPHQVWEYRSDANLLEQQTGEDGILKKVQEVQGHRHLLTFVVGPSSWTCLGKVLGNRVPDISQHRSTDWLVNYHIVSDAVLLPTSRHVESILANGAIMTTNIAIHKHLP
ncbi:hypothetical protein BU15DRAFT_81705 [Melanogaster broomeanus]|nr:hypothetical protein BU15DRAFT_81705 [Melanogaster broomeanus]